MRTNKLNIFLISWVICLVIYFSGYFALKKYKVYKAKNLYEKLKSKPLYYCYQISNGELFPVFYIETIDYKANLLKFYNKNDGPFGKEILFPSKMIIAIDSPLIIFNSKTGLMEFAVFNTDCWGYYTGYVDKRTLHKNPPPEKLKAAYLEDVRKMSTKNNSQNFSNSAFGFQCD